MSEDEILRNLKYYFKQWRKGGHITSSLKDKLDNLLFYKDWDIAAINTKTSRQRAWLIKTQVVCVGCGSDQNLEQDHIHPKSKGGKEGLHNKQLLCRRCNRKKADKIPHG